MTAPVRVRFAPSPTGYLHIGGVRTALFNWLWARKTGGAFVLRIEDTDQERSTAESRQVILDSLRWLGMDWDEGPDVGGGHGPYVQTERLALYREHAERLVAEGKAFKCWKTKEELDAARNALKERDPKAQFSYPRAWREQEERPGAPYVVRFKVPDGGQVTYVDKVFGEITTPNSAQQDFVLLRSDGIPLYNFGCVVDDVTMGITLVARGRDHMVNTPPQILLYEALGAPVPEFAHLPMMLNQKGAKLSKRDGAVGVFEYRDQGYAPHAVLNYLARFGWSSGDREVFSLPELVEAFSWEACGRPDGKFDPKKFQAIQHEHLKSAALVPDDVYAERTLPFLAGRGVAAATPDDVKRLLPFVRERAKTFVEAASILDYFLRETPVEEPEAVAKVTKAEHAPRLTALADRLEGAEAWEPEALEAAVGEVAESLGLQLKELAPPARVALSGRGSTPGLGLVLWGLGKPRALARLRAFAARCAGAGAGA